MYAHLKANSRTRSIALPIINAFSSVALITLTNTHVLLGLIGILLLKSVLQAPVKPITTIHLYLFSHKNPTLDSFLKPYVIAF